MYSKIYCEFLRLYFAPETNNLSVSLKKIPIENFERILDLKKFINEEKTPEKKGEEQKNHLKEMTDNARDDLLSSPSGLLKFSDVQSKNTKFSFKNIPFQKNIDKPPESGIEWLDDYLENEANQKARLKGSKISLKFNDTSSLIEMDNNVQVDGKITPK